VKKAYRKMAVKYHPEKLIGVSDDIKKLAEEKFLVVKESYEQIMKEENKDFSLLYSLLFVN